MTQHLETPIFTISLGSTFISSAKTPDVLPPLPFVTAVFKLVQVAMWLHCNVPVLLNFLCCFHCTSKQAIFGSEDELDPESRLASAIQAS